ncbi:recombinase family protein [Streptomyces hygroscopicus]|uniref:recombinase family protein n=1 Tax=Streptomyces hygroscopicus TaxID=1912 RepID=UPI0036C7B86A
MPSLDLAAAVVPRRGIDLATLAEELRASDVGLEFLTGELQGTHDPSGVVFTVLAALSGMEREYIRDRTLEGHESARRRGTAIGGAGVTNDSIAVRRLEARRRPDGTSAAPSGPLRPTPCRSLRPWLTSRCARERERNVAATERSFRPSPSSVAGTPSRGPWPSARIRVRGSWTVGVAPSSYLTARTVTIHPIFIATAVSTLPLVLVVVFPRRRLVRGGTDRYQGLTEESR